jgi:hypothetical protein
MGLDMTLSKKFYIGAEYEWNNITGTVEVYQNGEKIPIPFNEIQYIECNAAQWRKANQIHQWFVENVQSGEDDCKQYYVSREQLKELIELCKQVLINPESAPELLPSQSGFFFGSTEYDEYYMEDLKDTIEQLEDLDLSDEFRGEYYYSSSW